MLERAAHERLHGRALGEIRRAGHAAREHDELRRRCQQLGQRAVARDGHAVRTDDGVCVLNGHGIRLQSGAAENIERDETFALLEPFGKQQITFRHDGFPFLKKNGYISGATSLSSAAAMRVCSGMRARSPCVTICDWARVAS